MQTSEEPFYVRQTADETSEEGKRKWFHAAAQEAFEQGATWSRYTVHETVPDLILIEAWRVRPDEQGEPRWALTAARA